MVQAGAPYDYHDHMDENADTSWTQVIKDAVKDFVGAVAESSNQLASAAEKFAADSMLTIDEAAARAERSASSSTDMAQNAQKAAEDARLAADSLQNAVNEATDRLRSELSEGAAIQLAQVQETGDRLRIDLQGHVEEMISRMTAAAGSNVDAVAAAEAATNAAREAADRVQQSVSAVEAAVASAQRAADEARAAAERSETSANSISDAVSAAREAAEASRQSAEQAGAQSTVLGGEANMLLERLETDYDLLTRLVRDLHSRIASLSLPSVPSTEVVAGEEGNWDAAPAVESLSDEASTIPEAPAPVPEEIDSGYGSLINDENAVRQAGDHETEAETRIESSAPQDMPAAAQSDWLHASDENTAWEAPATDAAIEPEAVAEVEPGQESHYSPYFDARNPVWEMPAAQADPEATAEPVVEAEPGSVAEPAGETSYWPQLSDADTSWDVAAVEADVIEEAEAGEHLIDESSSYMWTQALPVEETPAFIHKPAYESPETLAYETSVQPVTEPEAEILAQGQAWNEVSVSGRVQVCISPVQDFDRLLSLDGALGRVSGVDSVTLADYTQEEVTFRVEVLGEKDAGLFTREIAVAAGVDATLVDAADNGLVIRIN